MWLTLILTAMLSGIMWVEIDRHMEESAKKRCKIIMVVFAIAICISAPIP